MICKNCGEEIRGGDRYCSSCGSELHEKNFNPDHKPLQRKFLRGDYWEEEEDFEKHNRVYYEDENEYEKENYHEEYEEPKKSGGLLSSILILLIALVIGFIMGVILFTGYLQSLPLGIG